MSSPGNPLYSDRGEAPRTLVEERRQYVETREQEFRLEEAERAVADAIRAEDEDLLSRIDELTSERIHLQSSDLFPVSHKVLAVPYKAWLPDHKMPLRRVAHVGMGRFRPAGTGVPGPASWQPTDQPVFTALFTNVQNKHVSSLGSGPNLDEMLAQANAAIQRYPDPHGWRPFRRPAPVLTREMFRAAFDREVRETARIKRLDPRS